MTDDIDIIHSPLEQTYSADGHTVRIWIYCGQDRQWILEIEDEQGTSTVWDDPFDTDQAALETALLSIEAEGIDSFVTSAQQAAKEAELQQPGARAQAAMQPQPHSVHEMTGPLSDPELDELDKFLLYEVDDEEGMTLDALDGYLHAIAIGPETIAPRQWLPKVWGQGDAMMPPVDNIDQLNHILGLVMRHFNSIISGFEQSPRLVVPYWGTCKYATGEFEDAEAWASGFADGVKLNRAAWQALFDAPDGQRWYRPIGLLGDDAFSADQDDPTRTPEQRQALAQQIEEGLVNIHAYWLPMREAIHERQLSKRMGKKVGRNEPCPCGSGKKFKKCCGASSVLH